jgi:hypothetical protein
VEEEEEKEEEEEEREQGPVEGGGGRWGGGGGATRVVFFGAPETDRLRAPISIALTRVAATPAGPSFLGRDVR